MKLLKFIVILLLLVTCSLSMTIFTVELSNEVLALCLFIFSFSLQKLGEFVVIRRIKNITKHCNNFDEFKRHLDIF